MFADSIKARIHPATWAVLGVKRKGDQAELAHRGTAFAADGAGRLLTCWHVTFMDQECKIECDEFVVTQPELGPAQYRARLVQKERDRDVALLEIVGGKVQTQAVRLAKKKVPFGTSCCAFGHALSVTDVANKTMRIFTRAAAGIVSMPYGAARFPGSRPIKLYELDFFTHGGSSGGPVFLPDGTVFAFVSGSLMVDDGTGDKRRSNLSVAIDIDEAIEFLKPLNI